MANTYDDLKKSGGIEDSLAKLKATLEASKEKKTGFDKDSYESLLAKYEEALVLIETLKNKIDSLQQNKLPTKDEVESMSAMIELLGKIDNKTINKIGKLGNKS